MGCSAGRSSRRWAARRSRIVREDEELPCARGRATPLEAALRNMLSICCLSETVAVSLIGAERLEMPAGELRKLLTEDLLGRGRSLALRLAHARLARAFARRSPRRSASPITSRARSPPRGARALSPARRLAASGGGRPSRSLQRPGRADALLRHRRGRHRSRARAPRHPRTTGLGEPPRRTRRRRLQNSPSTIGGCMLHAMSVRSVLGFSLAVVVAAPFGLFACDGLKKSDAPDAAAVAPVAPPAAAAPAAPDTGNAAAGDARRSARRRCRARRRWGQAGRRGRR